jgi:ABC-type transport system involved in multi-copper enzyme maturation permease subunit
MQSFLAILRESVREAMDAKVIYVLFAMSLLLLLFTASMSFEPAPPDRAFPTIVKKFGVVFPDQGQGKVPIFTRGIEYKAVDAKETGKGQYALRLEASPSDMDKLKDFFSKSDSKQNDGLRLAVFNWLQPAGKTRSIAFVPGMQAMQVADLQKATDEELRAVTDDQIAAFLRHQFEIHAGFGGVEVKRVTSGVKEPDYAFDIQINSSSGVRGWPHTTKLFFGGATVLSETPLGIVLWIVEDQIINGFGAVLTLLVGIIVTGFFIPNMLRKGALDLLITKPISRVGLLVYKYIGGLTFVFVLTAFTVGGMWTVIGLRSGFWDPSFLSLIPILTFTFAILYAFSTLVAVFTRSAIAAILLTCGFAFFLYLVGVIKTSLDGVHADEARRDNVPRWVYTTVDVIHGGLPRYKDLDRLTTKLLTDSTMTPLERFALAKAGAEFPDWAPTFGVSLAFIAVCLGLASWRFVTRDG